MAKSVIAPAADFNDDLHRSPEERKAAEVDAMVDDLLCLTAEDRARVFALVESLLREQRERPHRHMN